MGFVGSLINGGDAGDSGSAGFNYQAKGPQQEQMSASWNGTQNALGYQRSFLDSTTSQGGLGNQSNVFQQQQALANNLQAQASGMGGPSIAQQQYQQNMNQLAAQQAGLIGSQKGISPALQARLMAQQGAGARQAAAGQSATLGAQEQWAATQALQQQQANMGNLSTQQVGQQANATNAYTQANLGQQSNLYGLQSGATAANAGVAGKTIGGQEKLVGSLFGGAAMAHGGLVKNYADGGQVDLYSSQPMSPQVAAPDGPASNAGMQLSYGHSFSSPSIQFDPDAADPQKKQKQQQQKDNGQSSSMDQANNPVDMGGGAPAGAVDMAPVESADIAGGAASGAAEAGASSGLVEGAAAALNKGGSVKNFADGGDTGDLGGMGSSIMKMLPMLVAMLSKGGGVPQLNGEAYGMAGIPVPGKAKVGGDSLQNDTVPARLSPGEVIIPRSVMNSKDPPKAAAKMVRDIIAKKKKRAG